MNKAIESAEGFIRRTIPDTIYQRHFKLSLPQCEVVKITSNSDTSSTSYSVYFVDSINFIPDKFELRYCITIEGDTLNDWYVIPIDSLGNTAIDTSNFHYIYDNLLAYKKLLLGQYKFDYKSVKQFIKAKRLKDCNIQLSNSMGRIYDKGYMKMKNHKHFWYVSFYQKDYEIIYRIDPETGRYTLLKHRHQVVA
jgi:hypothetical protein